MPERKERPQEQVPWIPKQGDSGGPTTPNVNKPDTKKLIEKLKSVDSNNSKKFRQRSGE